MNQEGREFDSRSLRGRRAGLKTGHYDFEAIAQTKTNAGRWFPPDEARAQRGLVVAPKRAQPRVAVLPRCRDGAGKSYFVCDTMRGCGSATLLDYSSRRFWRRRAGQAPPLPELLKFAGANRGSVAIRAVAPGTREKKRKGKNLRRGRRVHRVRGAEKTKRTRRKRLRICDEVGRGVGQGYFA